MEWGIQFRGGQAMRMRQRVNRGGFLLNMFTLKPIRFQDKAVAETYARLSFLHYKTRVVIHKDK